MPVDAGHAARSANPRRTIGDAIKTAAGQSRTKFRSLARVGLAFPHGGCTKLLGRRAGDQDSGLRQGLRRLQAHP